MSLVADLALRIEEKPWHELFDGFLPGGTRAISFTIEQYEMLDAYYASIVKGIVEKAWNTKDADDVKTRILYSTIFNEQELKDATTSVTIEKLLEYSLNDPERCFHELEHYHNQSWDDQARKLVSLLHKEQRKRLRYYFYKARQRKLRREHSKARK